MSGTVENQPSGRAPHRARRENQQAVIDCLISEAQLSRAEIQSQSGLSRSTLSDVLQALIAEGVVEELDAAPERQGRGRPTRPLRLSGEIARVAGVALTRAGSTILVAGLDGEVTAATRIAAPEPFDLAAATSDAATALAGLLRGADGEHGLAALAVGLPRPITATRPGRRRPPAERGEAFAEAVGVHPEWDNNSRLTALAEAQWGAGRGYRDFAYLHLDRGVGGGLILDGRLATGARGTGSEFGHLCVDPVGPRCWCGGVGCLEMYASMDAILKAARLQSSDELAEAATQGVVPAVDDAALRVAQAVSGIVSVVDVGRVVLGGSVAQVPGFVAAVAKQVAATAGRHATDGVVLVRSAMGDDAPARGGVALALRSSHLLDGYRR
ncbi:ROK family transcriptional regulator [Demequina aurantiaca]|uniref:ROK family transcriptional regulator n=1 Tax=Demequina aurantiaca TaxID=676200 RepID=UPI0007831CAB|nr:ROK family transcriptional regulator [Demequina aurantiaca]